MCVFVFVCVRVDMCVCTCHTCGLLHNHYPLRPLFYLNISFLYNLKIDRRRIFELLKKCFQRVVISDGEAIAFWIYKKN